MRQRIGIAIGDSILNLAACAEQGLLEAAGAEVGVACAAPNLNVLMALGAPHWTALRRRASELLREGSPRRDDLLVRMSEAALALPACICDYTDFYASVFHATNVGRLFRPDNPLLPNYKWVPIAYHGRASSIVVSGTEVRRPQGQLQSDPDRHPVFGPTRSLDYELEVGMFIGPSNALGEPVAIGAAEQHIFGFCLVNDWSARDIQRWEYQPLGPFLAKSFATTISPWVVTTEALEPFRVAAFRRPQGDPAPLPHLFDVRDQERGGIGLTLEVLLATAQTRRQGLAPLPLSRSNFADMYWTPAQMLAHHTSNGCNLRTGDLLASGTVSGPEPSSCGCLLELKGVQLPTGETRRFLEDGDEVVMRGWCQRKGFRRIGLGECRGKVMGNGKWGVGN